MKISVNRKLALIVGGSAVLLGFGLLGGFYFLHHQSRSASAQVADAKFRELRSRFATQQPLLDMVTRGPFPEIGSRNTGTLHSFHTVIFDTRGEQRLVHMTVPYWFVKMFPRSAGRFEWLGQLTFLDDTEFDPEAIRLTLAQIERHGPGLLVDFRHPSGGQFMAWTE
jgi:hypothetical protein